MNERIHTVRIPFTLPVSEERKVQRVVFSYIVIGQRVCLVDTGPAGGEQRICDALTLLGKSPKDADLVVNTHEHPDHIGGNAFFSRFSEPRFACHADAVRWIETLDIQYKERPIHGFYGLAGQPVHIHKLLHDGETIDLGGGTSLQVIFTPGHSPGSISLFCPQDSALIIGDAIQPVDGLPLYIDPARTRASLRRLMSISGVKKMYLSSVEEPYTGEAITRAFTASLEYLDRVEALAKKAAADLPEGATPEAIAGRVLVQLGLDPPPVMSMTVTSIMAHLS
jgi:hydroxyacylglutathione hydrolase